MSNKRNEPCPCGSGKKYKKCCGFQDIVRRQLKDKVLKCGPLVAAKEMGHVTGRFFQAGQSATKSLMSAKKITLGGVKPVEGKQ
ncbi:MAG TPA: SEC-C metal-binding domain-containing protein [Chlamydiales bacterium]|nr:SEC-C metal-binding domain-containing protein [Chlamydiales bacterium]